MIASNDYVMEWTTIEMNDSYIYKPDNEVTKTEILFEEERYQPKLELNLSVKGNGLLTMSFQNLKFEKTIGFQFLQRPPLLNLHILVLPPPLTVVQSTP